MHVSKYRKNKKKKGLLSCQLAPILRMDYEIEMSPFVCMATLVQQRFNEIE